MSLFSIFSKKQPEATSVAEALAGATSTPSTKSKKRNADVQNEQLVPEKKRARRRLVGAIAMVLAIVIGLPMMLDTEPQHLNKNIVIQIPSKDSESAPLNSKEEVEKTVSNESIEPLPKTTSSTPSTTSSSQITNSSSPVSTSSTKSETKSENKNEIGHTEAPTNKDASIKAKAAESSSTTHQTNNADESARAMAILNGTTSISTDETTAKTPTRIVVQVGAFATQEKVNELRDKLTAAGIKSYTQIVKTSSGEKIRVRVGPFSDKDSANKAKLQLEKLGLSSSLITL